MLNKSDVTTSSLLSRMIVVDPKDRITVDEVLAHPWCSKVKIGGPINGLVHEVIAIIRSQSFRHCTMLLNDVNVVSLLQRRYEYMAPLV